MVTCWSKLNYSKTLVCKHYSFQKHACNAKHSYNKANCKNHRLSCDHVMFGVMNYSLQDITPLTSIRNVCSSSRAHRSSCPNPMFTIFNILWVDSLAWVHEEPSRRLIFIFVVVVVVKVATQASIIVRIINYNEAHIHCGILFRG